MKKAISFIIAIFIVAAVCAGLAKLLTGISTLDAIIFGLVCGISGALAPIVAAWFQKKFTKNNTD